MTKTRRNSPHHAQFPRLRTILHPTSFSCRDRIALAHAMKLALATRATLDILYVNDRVRQTNSHAYQAVQEMLVRWGILHSGGSQADVTGTGINLVERTDSTNDFGSGILEFLDHHPHDLVVMSTHQTVDTGHWLHREVETVLSCGSNAPTLFVPEGTTGFVDVDDGVVELSHILLPFDETPSPQPALTVAGEIISALNVQRPTLSMLHVSKEHTDIPTLRYPGDSEWRWEWLVRPDNVVAEIVKTAEQKAADMIVMTTLGNDGWFDRETGGTTEQVLQQTPCLVSNACLRTNHA